MAVFETIIKPAAAGGFGHWRSRIAFGDRLPSERTSGLSHLEVDNAAEASLFAAFAGKISTHEPTGFLRPSEEAAAAGVSPDTALTLYLEPSTAKLTPEWQALADVIARRFTGTADSAFSADSIGYLVYRNVDAAQAKAALCSRIKTRPAGPAGGCDDNAWNRFVAGQGHIVVQAGDRLGAAGPAYLPNTAPNRLQCAAALRTHFGMFDLGTFYSTMTSTPGVPAPAAAGGLATFFGSALPLIDPARAVDVVGSQRLWPWSALVEYKRTKTLTYSQWRRLGDLQKQKYRPHLLARVRPASSPPNTVRFDFDVDDLSNVFQLEAVVEFYMNFQEPWAAAAQPLAPGAPGYRIVNLLSLYGAAAQANGVEVTLDDQLDMSRVSAGRDTLRLDAEGRRPGKQFRIMGLPGGPKVTVDAAPQLSGGTSAWQILDSPTLVHVDAFGSRVRGARAMPGAARLVELQALSDEQLADLAQVNPHETISLATVTAGSGEARVLAPPRLDRAARTATLTLDRNVAVPAAGSAWAIPSGVGGVQGYLRKKPTSAASRDWGWDHYDGMLFLVAGGDIRCAFPWTSYTSRALDHKGRGTRFHSSIKGNRQYRFATVFSRNLFINVAFSVIDPDGVVRGNRQVSGPVSRSGRTVFPDVTLGTTVVDKGQNIFFSQSAPPRFSVAWISEVDRANDNLTVSRSTAAAVPAGPTPYWILAYDGVREARFYFKPGFDADIAPPNTRAPYGPDELGKGGIRIHLGGLNKTGSQGCQVSPYFMRLRMAMIAYHREVNQTYYAENATHPDLDRVRDMYTEQNKPPLIVEYENATEELRALEPQLKAALADPLARALDEVVRSGSDDASRLVALKDVIEQLLAKLRFVQDAADTPSEDEILPVLATLTELAADEDVTTMVQWAAEHAEEVAPLSQKVAELQQKIKDSKRWGWDDAVQGDYWLVRPDERAV